MPGEGYRGPQVCKIVGISYRQLDHWDRTGLKSPSLERARGSGTQRLYSYQDVVELRIIKQLLDAGITLQRARKAIDFLREQGAEISSASLVLGADGSVLARNDEELLDLLRGGQRVFNVVALSGVKGDVDSAIVEITGLAPGGAEHAAPEGSPAEASGHPSVAGDHPAVPGDDLPARHG
jgi:DNA-binding transcriptional MerR regulator